MRGETDEEFYLVSALTTQGSATPSYFKVLLNSGNVKMEFIAQITYSQCFMYYNW
jgi:hypothetical protein